MSCKISEFLNFHVSHLNHETFKLCLQNILNMSKTTRVYIVVLHPVTRPQALLTYRFILTGSNASQVCVGTRKWAKFRFIHMTLLTTDCGLLMQGKNGEVGWCNG